MKKAIVILVLLATVSLTTTVFATLMISNIDATWSGALSPEAVEPTCVAYANSADDVTNSNEVRYGQPLGVNDCPPNAPDPAQSGFAFNGSDTDIELGFNTIFPLGQFTHFNNPVFSAQPLTSADFTVAINALNETYACRFNVLLEETPNAEAANPNGFCPYPVAADGQPVGPGGVGADGTAYADINPDVNGDGLADCADNVTFAVGECNLNIPSTNPIEPDYYLYIRGFSNGSCATADRATLTTSFTTIESQQNDACVFAEFTVPPTVPTAVELMMQGDVSNTNRMYPSPSIMIAILFTFMVLLTSHLPSALSHME